MNDRNRECYYFFMEQNYREIVVDCDCGNVHKLSSMMVWRNSTNELVEYILQRNFKRIRVFVEKQFSKLIEIVDFVQTLKINHLTVVLTKMETFSAEVVRASNIEYLGEDFVVACGAYKLIDVAKYYCKALGLNLGCVMVGECFDFTFSKFARLYDGITYCFYDTVAPLCVVYFDNLQLKYSLPAQGFQPWK